jgi:hypothetical protein
MGLQQWSVTPKRDNPRLQPGVDGNKRTDSGDCAADTKTLATLTARLALRGIELWGMPGGGFLAYSRGEFSIFAEMAAVEAFAKRVSA